MISPLQPNYAFLDSYQQDPVGQGSVGVLDVPTQLGLDHAGVQRIRGHTRALSLPTPRVPSHLTFHMSSYY